MKSQEGAVGVPRPHGHQLFLCVQVVCDFGVLHVFGSRSGLSLVAGHVPGSGNLESEVGR
jgi:hypothetical protein